MRALIAWMGSEVVGTLSQTPQGKLRFAYAPSWLAKASSRAISMSLPLRPEPYTDHDCAPFFEGLLPEGDQRLAAARALGVSAGNHYALLDALGGEVAGALAFLHPNQTPAPDQAPQIQPSLDEAALADILDRLPARPFLVGEDGLRLSLAGAQAKLPVCLLDGRIHLPGPGQPTTHILKPALPRYPASTENEAFVMRLAAALGIRTAPVQPWAIRTPTGNLRTFLLVERYDRTTTGGRIQRLHQEDFCQALGVPSDRKYQTEGGPNVQKCFSLVRTASIFPAKDATQLLDVMILNVIVGNSDAHGKNFSLLHGTDQAQDGGPGGITLAPFYDLLSTAFYPGLATRFAMKIGDQGLFERLGPLAWQGFARDASVTYPFLRKRITTLADKTIKAAPAVLADLANPDLDQARLAELAELVTSRARKIIQTT